jgi:hypothetical protein
VIEARDEELYYCIDGDIIGGLSLGLYIRDIMVVLGVTIWGVGSPPLRVGAYLEVVGSCPPPKKLGCWLQQSEKPSVDSLSYSKVDLKDSLLT